MQHYKKYYIGSMLGTSLFSVGSLLSFSINAATWVDAPSSTIVKQSAKAGEASAPAENQFLPRKTPAGLQNQDHVRKWQYYRGIRVLGAEIIQHNRVGVTAPAITGKVAEGLTLKELTPRLNKETALQTAIDLYPDVKRVERSQVELVINLQKSQEKLAYLVTFFAHTPEGPKRPMVLLDAQSGEILRNYDGLTHAEVGVGPGGNSKTGYYLYGTKYPKLDVSQNNNTCTMETPNVRTIDLNNGYYGEQAFSFTCFENNYRAINGAYSPLNDAHYFGNTVYKMYNDWLNTAPLSFQLKMRVHYGNGYENAFWDGSSMTFGDGGSMFYPLVSLDIVSHEVSHGFTEQNSGLEYWGQSGGINEAFSDIAGEAAECYLSTKSDGSCTADFLVGATIFKGEGALRYMSNPPLDGVSIDNKQDFYDYLDVHYSSGVYNKAFYLLANEPGWGIKKAFMVFAKANQNYWISSTDFDSGACGVLYAAEDLKYDRSAVERSFNQVGVTCSSAPRKVVDTYSCDLRQGQWVYYGPFASTGRPLVAAMTGAGNSDLYVRVGGQPSDTEYDCAPQNRDSAETCTIPATSDIYVAVKGFSGTSSFKLSVSYYRQ